MRRITAALVVVCTTSLATAATAGAVEFGATEDEVKSSPETWYPRMAELGLRRNVISVTWDADDPAALPAETGQIEALLPVAAAHGVEVTFAVYQKRASGLASGPVAVAQFATWLQELARRFPQVREYVGPNEPNQPRFWQSQFRPDCTNASGESYFQTMAAMYDALKSVDAGIRVLASLSPRGNDRCRAASNVSTSPVRFLHHLGRAFRASGRAAPIMDGLSFHPYPNRNTDSPARGYVWPNVGVPNLDRLKQAFWDAFGGTAQPTFENGLRVELDEVGWQTDSERPGYTGVENVPPVDEGTQARFYAEVVRAAACDSAVGSLSFFHLVDEPDRDRFQSGLLWADGTPKASFAAVKEAIAEAVSGCSGRPVAWRHATTVVGARVDFGKLGTSTRKRSYWSFHATAAEDADYRAGIFRLAGSLDGRARASIRRSLSSSGRATKVASASGLVKANYNILVRPPKRRLAPGTYVYAIRMTAALNASRESFFVSGPFRVR